jgi:hypothetical protein
LSGFFISGEKRFGGIKLAVQDNTIGNDKIHDKNQQEYREKNELSTVFGVFSSSNDEKKHK